jgi:hypothetical protein
MRIIIVNDQDEVIGLKERRTLLKEDIYRVSGLWVTNSSKDILLAQRDFAKTHDPGKWGPAVAGTLDENETYESNIIKEAEEEVGLKNIHPRVGPKRRVSDGYNYFCQWYTLTVDKPAEDYTVSDHIIIYSHGFGVRKDDRGLFTAIAAGLTDAQHFMFDYNQADEATDTLTVTGLDVQAETLRQTITNATRQHPATTIDLVCHSQGCVVAAMVQPAGIRKIIFLAPPDRFLSVDQKIQKFSKRPGAAVHDDGSMTYPRRDGSTTIIPKAYWDSRQGIDPMKLYHGLAGKTDLLIIQADKDEVIGDTDFSGLTEARIVPIHTGHDFEGDGRRKLINILIAELIV